MTTSPSSYLKSPKASAPLSIVWHQTDLRTEANPLLIAAAQKGEAILPLFIYAPDIDKLGSAATWWLQESLTELRDAYRRLGIALLVEMGDPLAILIELIEKTGARIVYWNLRFEPSWFSLHLKISSTLKTLGVEVRTFNGNHLVDPRLIHTREGKHYTVFAPFYATCLKNLQLEPLPSLPKKIAQFTPSFELPSFPEEKWPKEKWMEKLNAYWKPGRSFALRRLIKFGKTSLSQYEVERNIPGIDGTSMLSASLHFGEVSPQEVWQRSDMGEAFRRQLIWREFATYFLFHFPEAEARNWNVKFDPFSWDNDPSLLDKWKKGKTGYPIVDAGMRQLWEMGWMHNRVRMVVASFLTKDLLIDWREGEKWFWDTLVDADKGNNVLGWQWTAGSGPDAAPYFRIFNPVLQGEKFDPMGEYVKRFIPELKELPSKWIHRPWEAPPELLKTKGIELGKTYPYPIINHKEAREEALRRFARL